MRSWRMFLVSRIKKIFIFCFQTNIQIFALPFYAVNHPFALLLAGIRTFKEKMILPFLWTWKCYREFLIGSNEMFKFGSIQFSPMKRMRILFQFPEKLTKQTLYLKKSKFHCLYKNSSKSSQVALLHQVTNAHWCDIIDLSGSN